MTTDNRHDPILERARRLRTDLPPSRDLWPEIRAQIEEGAARPASAPGRAWNAWVPAALAASVVVAVGIVLLLNSPGREAPETPVAGAPAPVDATQASFGPSFTLGPTYDEARGALVRDFEARIGALPPETAEVVVRNLETIRAAVAEINEALAKDPGNLLLQQLLMSAYLDELAVLTDVRRVTQKLSTPERNEI